MNAIFSAAVRRAASARWAAAAVTSVALVIPVGWALTTGSGSHQQQVALSSGQAWLASPSQGLVTLIDGPSEQVVAVVAAPSSGAAQSVTQQGSSALVVDDKAGTVTRIDGATQMASTPYQFATSGAVLSVLAASSTAYVIDAKSRMATVIDPTSMKVIRKVPMAARPGAHQSLADAAGRLWAVDADGSGLNWYDPNGDHGQQAANPTDQIVVVDGKPAIVEVGAAQPAVSWLGADGTRTAWSCRLATRSGDKVQLLGAASGQQIFAAVSQAGTLVTTNEGGSSCDAAVTVGDPGAQFGDLVQSGRFVFVPNRTNGKTYVVDAGNPNAVLSSFDLAKPGNDLELVAKDGLVFYNDLDSQVAGVLSFSGGVWNQGDALQKYNPTDPTADVQISGSGSTSSSTPVTTSTTRPLTVSTPPSDTPVTATTARTPPFSSSAITTTFLPGSTTARTTTSPPGSTIARPTSPSTSTSISTSTTPLAAPVIAAFTVDPTSIGIEQSATLHAHITNSTNAQWQVAVSATGCSFTQTTPLTALSADQQRTGDLLAPIGPLPWGCLGDYSLVLSVESPAGAAPTAETHLTLTSDASTTPVIASMSCTPSNPVLAEPVTCTAVETVDGSRGTWTWTVTDGDNNSVVVGPIAQSANTDFVPQLARIGHFTVTLVVNYRGATDTAVADLRSTVSVPSVVGFNSTDAQAQLTGAGLVPAVVPAASHQPSGTVIAQSGAGGPALYGDSAPITVSAGPNAAVSFYDLAPGAAWSTGAGPLTFQGNDGDNRGFARIWAAGEKPLEDASGSEALETHPQWVDNGWIQGDFNLPNQILAGDHFKVSVGFRGGTAGKVIFTLSALLPGPTVLMSQEKAVTGSLVDWDVDLTPAAGSQMLRLSVSADGVSTQDWAIWVNPRIE